MTQLLQQASEALRRHDAEWLEQQAVLTQGVPLMREDVRSVRDAAEVLRLQVAVARNHLKLCRHLHQGLEHSWAL